MGDEFCGRQDEADEFVVVSAPFSVFERPPLMVAAVLTTKSGRRVGRSLRLVVVSVCGGWGGKEEFAIARRRCSPFSSFNFLHSLRPI